MAESIKVLKQHASDYFSFAGIFSHSPRVHFGRAAWIAIRWSHWIPSKDEFARQELACLGVEQGLNQWYANTSGLAAPRRTALHERMAAEFH